MASWIKTSMVLLALIGCEENTQKMCEESPWTYENTGEIFMLNWCTSCHHSELTGDSRGGATDGVNLNGFENVAAFLDRIDAVALSDSPTMPPSGGPTEAELDRMREWLTCGAPE